MTSHVAGGDALMTDKYGQTVSVYVYEDKGKLVFDRRYRLADLPGLWAAGAFTTRACM